MAEKFKFSLVGDGCEVGQLEAKPGPHCHGEVSACECHLSTDKARKQWPTQSNRHPGTWDAASENLFPQQETRAPVWTSLSQQRAATLAVRGH